MGKKKGTGKSPKGRAGAKKKAQKGGPSAGRASSFMRSADFTRQMANEDYDDNSFKFFRGFAQSSQRNLPPRNPALKLRHQAITFVSASTNTPVESDLENKLKLSEEAISVAAEGSEEEEDDDEEDEEFDDSTIQTNIISDTGVEISRYALTHMHIHSTADMKNTSVSSDVDMMEDEEHVRPASSEALPFVVDTEGDENLVAAFNSIGKPATRRDVSPAPSDSSEEVVVFHGRNKGKATDNHVSRASGKKPVPQQRSQNVATPPLFAPVGTTPIAITSRDEPNALNDTSDHQTGKHSAPQSQPYVNNHSSAPPKGPSTSGKPAQERPKGWATRTSKVDEEVNADALWAPAPSHPYWKKNKPRPDLNPSPAEIKALNNTPNRQSQVAFAPSQVDGAVETAIDVETSKKIERLAKITRVQAKEDASPPTHPKKQAKMHNRIANIAMLESELSPEHVELARGLAAEESLRLEQAARDREEKKRAQPQTTSAGPSNAAAEMVVLNDVPWKLGKTLVAYPESDDDDAVEESIISLQADWNAVQREKGKVRKRGNRRKRGMRKDNRHMPDPIVSDEEDAAEEAAYDDYMANLAAQLDEDDTGGDASNKIAPVDTSQPAAVVETLRVMHGSDTGVVEEITDDEEEQEYAFGMNDDDTSSASTGPIGQDRSDMSDMSSSELEDELEYTEREQWEDEEDLRRRRQERMTDEQIARIFAKQEELGIHDDEMVIENGEYGDVSDGIGDVMAARAGLANIGSFSAGRSKNKHGMRRSSNRGAFGFSFPDASALADSVEQYGENGFDIMDFDRPSLRPRKKGRRGGLPPELEALSDEELKSSMVDAWDNDRAKKRLKKAEREELRAQGLLGAAGRKGKADLSQKYQFGMSTKQVHDELRSFLQDEGMNSRPFPPMGKHDRKELHELANALNLNSKSVGAGKNRFPVLHKTSRTPEYSPEMFDRAVNASVNGWLDRDKRFGKKMAKKGAKAPRDGFGGRVADATIRNGEVVGAGAAEIGKENFGHKLMEKMGWSKGMALGKEGEGLLLPVEQVMRAGRGGLGG